MSGGAEKDVFHPKWADLADSLLRRAALVARVERNRSPDPLAGLKVDDDDLDALLGEIPGLDESAERAHTVAEALAPSVRSARRDFETIMAGDSRFANLVRRAALEPDAAVVLAVLCAVEADPRRQRLVGYLNDDVTARRPTLWTLERICGPEVDPLPACGPSGPLRAAALIEPTPEGPWASTPVTVAPGVLWWLHGVDDVEPAVTARAECIEGPGGGTGSVVVVSGTDRVRRLQAAARAVASERLLVIDTSGPDPLPWDELIRAATLDGAAVVLEVTDHLDGAARARIAGAPHLAWAVTSPRDLPLGDLPAAGWTSAPVDPPDATSTEWEAAFGPGTPPTHPLSAEQVHLAGRAASALTGSEAERIPAAVRRLAAGHIDSTANRIRPTRSWDDLVLDPGRERLVRNIAVRCRRRNVVYGDWGFSPFPSKGVVALFAGPSGTGKTLAAEVIAGDLGVDLYTIDLSNMVSKYIGETEKNLSRVFDAAEASNVALFFDEADALLGKRSAVSDAHDRYANIEVAYLLQRLERYEGLAVMATNLVNNLDPAFVRRLHVVVEFPVPQAGERRRIWRRSLAAGAPVAPDLDLDALADQFELTGGTIRNAILSAAFLAAEAGTPITMALALVALQEELRKIGRLVADSDLAPFASYLADVPTA